MITKDEQEWKLEYAAEALDYDPETGFLTWREDRRNGNARAGTRAGSVNGKGYRQIRITIDGKIFALFEHRLAWFITHGEVPAEIDHINVVRDDNRIANLRACNHGQNIQNSPTRKDNSSGNKGVSWSRKAKKWQAQVQANGKRIYLGFFESLEEATAVVRAAREELHGEFANHGDGSCYPPLSPTPSAPVAQPQPPASLDQCSHTHTPGGADPISTPPKTMSAPLGNRNAAKDPSIKATCQKILRFRPDEKVELEEFLLMNPDKIWQHWARDLILSKIRETTTNELTNGQDQFSPSRVEGSSEEITR